MSGPNDQQRKLIENTEGIYIADAGPGTGKTYTISLRYAHILENMDVDPDDILLITFTNNAAENMKERIINKCSYDKAALRDAPISTFHSRCSRILQRYGFKAPKILGIDDRLTSSTGVIENEVIEMQEFMRFVNSFIEEHPEYNHFYRTMYNYGDLLGLIKSLGAKGIIPTKESWFRNSDKHLDGDFDKFKELFDEKNEPIPGANGFKQSELRSKMNKYKNKCFTKDAPSYEDIRGDGPDIPAEWAETCFQEDREELKQFIHDIYFEYIKYALSRNYINYSLMIMFAFALLCEDHELRKKLAYDYVMVDEFQDTNEIQFKLALLLSKNGNICVVGDWKQSIFSFQYASVDNIIQFEDRLNDYKEELNQDFERITYPVDIKEEIPLVENYRSTQDIIDFSEQGLLVEATKKERLDKEKIKEKITKLKEVNNPHPTEIGAYTADDEIELILWKITELVDNEDYEIKDGDDMRKLEYEDIAVLTRTRKFGLKLLNTAEDSDVPVAYEGGIELFLMEPSLLLLAWLRVVKDAYSKRGWSVILERAGYKFPEVKHILSNHKYPSDMLTFRNRLRRAETIGQLSKMVFERYSINDAFSDKITEVLQSIYNSTYLNISDMINFIEENIETNQTHEVDSTTEENVFKIQTIHSSKGLEYPVIMVADIGGGGGGFGSTISFNEPIGLRQNKIYSEESLPFNYDNWKKFVLSRCLGGDHDEERRLFYVAMTRAKNYLYLTAQKDKESEFFNNMDIEPEYVEPEIKPVKGKIQKREEFSAGAVKTHSPVKYSCHSLIDESCFENGKGMGTEYGSKVHNFAERYVKGENVEPDNKDEENVKKFIDSLDGELMAEIQCLLPLEVKDRRILFDGIIDLIHVQKDLVQVIDYKTDRDRDALKEYRKQLSVYHNVLEGVYPRKKVESYVFYTEKGELVPVDAMGVEELGQFVE